MTLSLARARECCSVQYYVSSDALDGSELITWKILLPRVTLFHPITTSSSSNFCPGTRQATGHAPTPFSNI